MYIHIERKLFFTAFPVIQHTHSSLLAVLFCETAASSSSLSSFRALWASKSPWAAAKRLLREVGWWYAYPLKNMKVNWDDDIPNISENKKMFQTTNREGFAVICV